MPAMLPLQSSEGGGLLSGVHSQRAIKLWFIVAALALSAALLFLPSEVGARALMPCGTAPHYPFQSATFESGDLRWHKRPKRCTYSTNGTVAGTIRFVDLRWKRWGGRRATARGKVVDNHDQDNNGFQRRPVKVTLGNLVRGLRPDGRTRRGPARYYTKLILFRLEEKRRYVIPLYRPGQRVYPEEG